MTYWLGTAIMVVANKKRPAFRVRFWSYFRCAPPAALSFQKHLSFRNFHIPCLLASKVQTPQHLGPRTASLLSWPAAGNCDLQMHSTGKETAQLLCAHTHGLKRTRVWRRIMPHERKALPCCPRCGRLTDFGSRSPRARATRAPSCHSDVIDIAQRCLRMHLSTA